MFKIFLVVLLSVSVLGWTLTLRRLRKMQDEIHQRVSRELTDVLPEVADRAFLTMHDTLFSITGHAPFIKEGADHYFSTQYSDLGLEYREALHRVQKEFFAVDKSGMSPIEFAKTALSAFDSVLAKYGNEIDNAHKEMMKFYEGGPMPRRDQNGFNWVKLW